MITAPTSSGFTYRIEQGAFQTSTSFQGLLPKTYLLTVKDERGCECQDSVQVGTIAAGPLYTAVQGVLATYCVSCHGGLTPTSGIDYSKDCVILPRWDLIKQRAVDGLPSTMPPTGSIPQNEKNKIIFWVNAGHRFTD